MSKSTSLLPRPPEFDDIQALVRFGHKHLTQACFLLLRVKDREAARVWLAAAPVSSAAETAPLPQTALHIALTSEGLAALGVAGSALVGFSAEFLDGMSGNPNRSARLGDIADSDPRRWEWGTGERLPHVLVMLYAVPGRLEDLKASVLAQCNAGFDQLACLTASGTGGAEPFGFADGISQPDLDWQRQRAARDEEQLAYANLTCLGEFLLGYPNEYGAYTDRPLLEPEGAAGALPRAEDAPEMADLGRNGSYLVMRQLSQDVKGFWQFLDRQAGGDATLREHWAAAMVGREKGGKALAQEAGAGSLNDFDYQSDRQGLRCPLGAHVRRANPRNADLPPGSPGFLGWLMRTLGFDPDALSNDRVASTRFHRLLRRGRAYGAPTSVEQAPAEAETGLHFICLGANIARQFEFVQGAWLIGTRFDGLRGEGDPLLGHRLPGTDGAPTDVFSLPRPDGPDAQVCGLPRFVSVRGGAYFFLPGIRALRYLATAR